jgi:deazaflavin-dependent oxidoreductase (nitroreductase family)
VDTKSRVARAPARTKLLNPITTTLMRLGVRPDPRMSLLTIRGRKTGRARTVPIGVFERAGRKYMVAAFGEVNWVLNLRAVGAVTITQGKHNAKYAAEQVQGEEAALVLRDCLGVYLASPLAGPMLRQRISLAADAPVNALVVEARRTPVFRLTDMRSSPNLAVPALSMVGTLDPSKEARQAATGVHTPGGAR